MTKKLPPASAWLLSQLTGAGADPQLLEVLRVGQMPWEVPPSWDMSDDRDIAAMMLEYPHLHRQGFVKIGACPNGDIVASESATGRIVLLDLGHVLQTDVAAHEHMKVVLGSIGELLSAESRGYRPPPSYWDAKEAPSRRRRR